LTLSAAPEAQFSRYDTLGKLETFDCPAFAAFKFSAFHSGSGGGITIGECPKEARFTESIGEQQARGFEAALSAVGGIPTASPKDLSGTLKPQVVRDRGAVYVHFKQWILSGVGGAGGHGAGMVETLLMIPPESKTVVFIQAGLSDNECGPRLKLPLCDDFRGTLREVARQVYVAQTSPAPTPAPRQELLRPGHPTICDSVVRAVREALEQSDEKRVPVTETIRYQQHAGQLDIQAGMREAARAHAQGMDIPTAARNVGEQCLSKPFKL
jgi:hypothetical protein